jgi:hypothetical protein
MHDRRRQAAACGNTPVRMGRTSAGIGAALLAAVACASDPSEAREVTTGDASFDGADTGGPPTVDLPAETSSSEAGSSGSDESESSAVAPDLPPEDSSARVRVVGGPTNDAELVKTLAVARNEDAAERRVVLRLGPDELPDLALGDRIAAPAEVQVTSRCDVGQNAPGCGYDPEIGARIVLRGADGSATTLASQTETCTKGEHHCMLVFRPSDASATIDEAVTCVAAGDCAIELEMWAWDPDARADGVDRVLVGENEGNYLENGIVKGDKARLMAVRERDVADTDRADAETTADGDATVPTDASSVLVYSHRLDDVRAGEQLVLDAKIVTAVASRARVSSKMYVTTDPADTEGASMDGIAPKMIGEHNGTNCTAGASPCTTRKVAVFEATEDLGTVYVNVVVRSAVPGGGTTSVVVERGEGWLRSTRYLAVLRG